MSKPPARIPMYTQIRDYILDNINENIWKPDDRLPSENELAAQFNVSRITVKNALSELTEKGLIYRVQGKGSFVSSSSQGEPQLYESEYNHEDKPLIAFLMPRLSNMFTARMLNGIEEYLTSHGYSMIFSKTHDSQEREKEVIKQMMRMNVKGIIIFPVEGQTYNEDILRLTISQFPIVLLDRYLRGIDTNCVYSDNTEGAFRAVKHLLELGHKRIGLLSTLSQGTTSIEDRILGYDRALAEFRLSVDQSLKLEHFQNNKMNAVLNTNHVDSDYKQEIKEFIQSNPDMTAVFSINSSIGYTFMEAVKELNIRIPEDLSFISYDYDPHPMAYLSPTYVDQNEYQLGKEAAALLLSVIANPKQERQKVMLTPELVLMDSTAPSDVK